MVEQSLTSGSRGFDPHQLSGNGYQVRGYRAGGKGHHQRFGGGSGGEGGIGVLLGSAVIRAYEWVRGAYDQ